MQALDGEDAVGSSAEIAGTVARRRKHEGVAIHPGRAVSMLEGRMCAAGARVLRTLLASPRSWRANRAGGRCEGWWPQPTPAPVNGGHAAKCPKAGRPAFTLLRPARGRQSQQHLVGNSIRKRTDRQSAKPPGEAGPGLDNTRLSTCLIGVRVFGYKCGAPEYVGVQRKEAWRAGARTIKTGGGPKARKRVPTRSRRQSAPTQRSPP